MKDDKYREAMTMLMEYVAKVAAEKGITQQQIADATGYKVNNVSRMLSARYAPRLDNFLKLADAAGVYFFMIDKDADDDLVKIMKERWGRIEKN